MKKIYFNIIYIALITLFSCEKTIVIDSQQSAASVVIEGLITDQPGKQYVKVSKTSDFYQDGTTERIVNATVVINDDKGNETPFIHNPSGDEKTEGYYYPNNAFTGDAGHIYSLSVLVDGDLYTAEDKLLPVTTIDSLSYRVNDDEKEDPKITGKFYELLAYMKEPQETKDYYLFKFYRNDSITYYLRNSDIYFTDDTGIGEDIDGIPSPVFFAINDVAKMEIYSLSRNAYLFYNDLFNLINNDGGMISPPPVNPRSNLSNGALGFFRTSSVHSASIQIK
ncbi:MAG: DUF4249 domain-containing protein [Cyclobacteriaceae bacterium]